MKYIIDTNFRKTSLADRDGKNEAVLRILLPAK